MLDQANYTPRLKSLFKDSIRAAMKEEFGYKSPEDISGEIMQINQTIQANDIVSGLNTDWTEKGYIDCYDGFTYIDGELHMVTVDSSIIYNSRNTLVILNNGSTAH